MQSVHDYIKAEETRYQTVPVPVVESYEWHMFDHIKLTTLYLNSQFKTGPEDNKPFRNIILPKVNLEHRVVQFDLKEIEFFINDADESYKAFLVKKWHERWALQNDISDFLDKMSECYTDYGGVLLKNTKDALEVVPLQRLAFCDQTDMMSGPICEKHQYSPDQLKEMEAKGWKNIDEVITLAREEKTSSQAQGAVSSSNNKAKTPGRYIEVYELHGMLPETFLNPDGDPNTFSRQMHIITYYTEHGSKEQKGITLFAGPEAKDLYKVFRRDEIYGRALGRGAVEEIFEPQVWVNHNEIAKMEMLDQATKVLYQTGDSAWKGKNVAEPENGDVLTYNVSPLTLVNTTTPEVTAFDEAIRSWDQQAKEISNAYDSISGQQGAHTAYRLAALLNQEAHALHLYRKTRLGIFLTEVYRDWIIPKMVKDVSAGAEFMSCLSLGEMSELVEQVVSYNFNQTLIHKVLSGQIVYPEDAQKMQDDYKQQFYKSNNKFLTILEGELTNLPLEVQANPTGEQQDNQSIVDKAGAVFTQATQVLLTDPNFFSNHPEMADLFNQIITSSGLSEVNFGSKGIVKPQAPLQNPSQPSQLTQTNGQPQVPSQPQAAGQNVYQAR